MRKAKIVATLGPASDTVEKIEQLIRAGLNVARVNMSHGTHDGHRKVIANIRKASKQAGREVAILMDLQGPKIRVDKLPEALELSAGETWVIGPSSVQSKYPQYKDNFIPTIYEKLVSDAAVGASILFDDGLIEARATDKDGDVLKIEIIVGGLLKSNKGINLPDTQVSAPSFTDKDREDLEFGLTQDIDYIAMSFVRKAEDIEVVRGLIEDTGVSIPIVAKIEKPEAVLNIDKIIEATDVIMIARGDMGVELGNHLVPTVQKKIINLCNYAGVPVITATQMLESMVENSRPTRAEASDVANAIWDGTDAVMLSGETAAGQYPVETIKMMSKIVEEAETTPKERPLLRKMDLSSVTAAIQVSASLIAEKVNSNWIMTVTESGNSCLKMSRFRPKARVLGVTNSLKAARKMCLYWGIESYHYDSKNVEVKEMEENVIDYLVEEGHLFKDEYVVVSRGDGDLFQQHSTNSVRVVKA